MGRLSAQRCPASRTVSRESTKECNQSQQGRAMRDEMMMMMMMMMIGEGKERTQAYRGQKPLWLQKADQVVNYS